MSSFQQPWSLRGSCLGGRQDSNAQDWRLAMLSHGLLQRWTGLSLSYHRLFRKKFCSSKTVEQLFLYWHCLWQEFSGGCVLYGDVDMICWRCKIPRSSALTRPRISFEEYKTCVNQKTPKIYKFQRRCRAKMALKLSSHLNVSKLDLRGAQAAWTSTCHWHWRRTDPQMSPDVPRP